MSAPPTVPAPSLSERLGLLFWALRHTLAAIAGRDQRLSPRVVPFCNYLARVAARFDRLALQWREGRLPAARPPRPETDPSAPPKHGSPPRSPPPRRGQPRAPNSAWLMRLGWQVRGHGSHLRQWLADPEVAAVLEASPQAGRLLRPLCRMFGIGPQPGLPAALFPQPRRRRQPPKPEPKAADPAAPQRRSATPPWRRPRPNLRSLAMVRVPSANWPKGV